MMQRTLQPLRAAVRPRPTFRSRPVFNAVTRRTAVSAAELQFGQPLHETHPHLIAPGDLTPGISALEYHHRRAALASKLPRNSVAILAANDVKFRSGAVFYEFHQEPSFFYLTGFNEPDAVAVIEKGETDVEYTFHLFVRPKDNRAELWDGARSGVQAAQDVFNADDAFPIDDLPTRLAPLINSASEIYTDIGDGGRRSALSKFFTAQSTQKNTGFGHLLERTRVGVRPLRPVMNELRLVKSTAELNNMRRAGKISGLVISQAMGRQYEDEKQLWTDLSYGFKSAGLDGEAYVPVIGGGKNALSIHYVRNDAQLKDGEVVLVDAGGECGGYITDITRTWPVNGRFSEPQRDLYQMILNVQKSCVSLCREDADVSLDKLHRICEEQLVGGLKDLGFNMSRHDSLELLFPHHVGHYIGLDVHDAPGYPRTDRLRENQCITIEPGIYVSEDERWPKHFRGLGIRIEDSVVIGKEKVEVLTKSAVKDVDAIEGMRN